MWNLVVKELLKYKKINSLSFLLFLGIIMLIFNSNLDFALYCIGPIFLVWQVVIGICSAGAVSNSEMYVLSLPVTRKEVALSKYLTTLIMSAIVILAVAILGVGLTKVGLVASYFKVEYLLLTLGGILGLASLSIPLFSFIKRNEVMGLFVLAVYGVVFLGKVAWNFIAGNLLELPMMEEIINSLTALEMSFLPVLIPAIILFIISALITIQLYQKKDF